MKIFFAKGIWVVPLYGAVLIVFLIFLMVTTACCDWIDRRRYHRQLERARRYRSF